MFAVIEIQTNSEGGMVLVPPIVYNTYTDALSAFYTKMVSAAQSTVYQHTVLIMDNVGQIIKTETIYHEAT